MASEKYAIILDYPILDGQSECLACGKKLKKSKAFLISIGGATYGPACEECRDKALKEMGAGPIKWVEKGMDDYDAFSEDAEVSELDKMLWGLE